MHLQQISTLNDIKCKPFLKLADFKFPFLPTLLQYVPNHFNRYHEPFLGTGSLFLAMNPHDAVLSDIHRELILCWRTIRDKPEEVVKEFRKHVLSEEYFKLIRGMEPKALSYVARAARVIYLTQAARSNVYCENKIGKFVVPFGSTKTKLVMNSINLNKVAEAVGRPGVKLEHYSFEIVLENTEKDDFVFLDPPHLCRDKPVYQAKSSDRFGFDDYKILLRIVETLTKRGVKVLLTSSDRPEIRERFRDFTIDVGTVKKRINDNGMIKVIPVNELIIYNYSL